MRLLLGGLVEVEHFELVRYQIRTFRLELGMNASPGQLDIDGALIRHSFIR